MIASRPFYLLVFASLLPVTALAGPTPRVRALGDHQFELVGPDDKMTNDKVLPEMHRACGPLYYQDHGGQPFTGPDGSIWSRVPFSCVQPSAPGAESPKK